LKIVLATRNLGKLREMRGLLGGLKVEVLSLADCPDAPEVVEDGKSFRENALKKARAVADFTGLPALSDDSGLCVDALDGAPGIYSARFAGEDADDAANNRKLLKLLKGVPDDRRDAKFVCVIALAWPDEETKKFKTFRGEVRGIIAQTPSGEAGFGYDPLFFYRPAGKTFAVMGPDKAAVSHRARALRKFREYLAEQMDLLA
jgi:XTP/dITP diphosphohydrolase